MNRLRLNDPSSEGTKGMSVGNSSGRDPTTGRFLAGHNMPGPGRNPKRQHNDKVRGIMLEVITPDDISSIMRKIVSMARAGDNTATKVFLDRLLGLPTQCISLELDESIYGNAADLRYL